MTDQPANARGEQTYLFQAWGETDLPFAAIAVGRQQVQDFIVSEWLGDPESDEIPGIMQEFDAHDFGDGPLKWEFEIGGVRITKVYTHNRANEMPSSARPETVQPKEPERDGRNESVVGEAVAAPLGADKREAAINWLRELLMETRDGEEMESRSLWDTAPSYVLALLAAAPAASPPAGEPLTMSMFANRADYEAAVRAQQAPPPTQGQK